MGAGVELAELAEVVRHREGEGGERDRGAVVLAGARAEPTGCQRGPPTRRSPSAAEWRRYDEPPHRRRAVHTTELAQGVGRPANTHTA